MNNTPSIGLSDPLVAAYLSDLEWALSSADQQERVDTIAAVREHLTDALGGDDADAEPTTDAVRTVLDELGSVEQIAASASPASAPPASAPRRSFLQATVAVSIVGLVVTLLLVVFSLALFRVSGGPTSVSGGPVPAVASYAPAPSQG